MSQQRILSNYLKRPASYISRYMEWPSWPFFIISSLINAFLPHLSPSSLSRPILPHQGHYILIKATSSLPRPHLPHLRQSFFLIWATSSSSRPFHTHQGHFFHTKTKAISSSPKTILPHQCNNFFFIKHTSSLSRPPLPHQGHSFLIETTLSCIHQDHSSMPCTLFFIMATHPPSIFSFTHISVAKQGRITITKKSGGINCEAVYL